MANSKTAAVANERVTLGETVITEIARREDVSPLNLPPLYETLESDLCDQLFESTPEFEGLEPVSFQYHGYSVRIQLDGTVRIVAQE